MRRSEGNLNFTSNWFLTNFTLAVQSYVDAAGSAVTEDADIFPLTH